MKQTNVDFTFHNFLKYIIECECPILIKTTTYLVQQRPLDAFDIGVGEDSFLATKHGRVGQKHVDILALEYRFLCAKINSNHSLSFY